MEMFRKPANYQRSRKHGAVFRLLVPSGEQIPSQRTPRDTLVMVAHESTVNEQIDFHEISPDSIQKVLLIFCIKSSKCRFLGA